MVATHSGIGVGQAGTGGLDQDLGGLVYGGRIARSCGRGFSWYRVNLDFRDESTWPAGAGAVDGNIFR